jgi:hypothetical protein
MKACLLMILLAGLASAAPVPNSPYLPVIYRYADAVLEQQRDQNFIRLLYTLSELSGKPKYRDAADKTVRAFLEKPPAELSQPWMLWNRSFEIAPEPSTTFALSRSGTGASISGFDLRSWTAGYARTTNEFFLKQIKTLLGRLESSKPTGNLSLAIDCDGAAHGLAEPVAARLRALARREDERFLSQQKNPGGLSTKVAMMCVSRYQNTGIVGYRDLIHAVADSAGSPSEDPAILGQSISLQLAAWRSTARPAYLDKAREFADPALAKFFKPDQYEVKPGMGTLALGLTELHSHILYITAVRCPPNAIDR